MIECTFSNTRQFLLNKISLKQNMVHIIFLRLSDYDIILTEAKFSSFYCNILKLISEKHGAKLARDKY